jgi:hypothetical protein
MANLQFLSNVTNHGVIFRGPIVKDNVVVAPGMVVDPSTDTSNPNLSSIALNLKDRGLVRETSDPATHSATVVGLDQYAIAVNAPSGSGQTPAAQLANQQEAAQKAALPNGFPQHPVQQPAQVQTRQPSPEEVAATAAAQN